MSGLDCNGDGVLLRLCFGGRKLGRGEVNERWGETEKGEENFQLGRVNTKFHI